MAPEAIGSSTLRLKMRVTEVSCDCKQSTQTILKQDAGADENLLIICKKTKKKTSERRKEKS